MSCAVDCPRGCQPGTSFKKRFDVVDALITLAYYTAMSLGAVYYFWAFGS
jgi:hypothetical protein